MSSTAKGNRLEDQFFEYLLDQQRRGELVFGLYPPDNCKIFKKKSYFSQERNGNVQFDVVIEVTPDERSSPQIFVIFECKNHRRPIQEKEINDFSAKLSREFRHAAKGVLVTSSRLQSGAENVARNSRMGIVKYDVDGIEIVADRKSRGFVESRFVEAQIFPNGFDVKALRFSAYYDGSFFGSLPHFLTALISEDRGDQQLESERYGKSVPFISDENIKNAAQELQNKIGYIDGPINLISACKQLSIDLKFTEKIVLDSSGVAILGQANFDQKSIRIHFHKNENRKRFTLGHEIGHFCLNHGKYICAENIVENDLFVSDEGEHKFNFDRLEIQANAFASYFLLPDDRFFLKVSEFRGSLGIKDRGHGYIYVDDQPANKSVYHQLLQAISSHFDVSKQVVELKLKKMKWLNDQRRGDANSIGELLKFSK